MIDNWDTQNPTPSEEPTTPAENTPAENTPAQQPQEPTQAPGPNWGNDGSYRYVPPRPQQPTPPPTPPTPPTYPNNPYYQSPRQPQQPWYGGNYTPPNGGFTPPSAPQPPAPTPEPPRKKGRGWIAVVAVLCALAVIASVVVVAGGIATAVNDNYSENVGGIFGDNDGGSNDGSSDQPNVNENAPTLEIDTWDTADGGLSTEEIVKRNYNSTVVLTAYAKTGNYYFGESNLTEVAGASGIVMTADGYVITNRHCVINENTGVRYDRVDVTTYDGTVYENAAIIGVDEATDLAVIKVNATSLTPAQFGNSDELEVGARVVALGNAAGLSWTATQGIVSAKAREVYEDTGYAIKCLQVDVPINSGNSGGPLLNKQGLVVGINSAKIAASGYEGLGFSIPINEAKVIIDSLLKYGYVKGRVALGIEGRTYASGQYKGFIIETITADSCLQGSGVAEGDLIVEVDGVEVVDYGTLRAQLAKHKVGDSVKIKVLRSESRYGNQVREITVTVTLREQKAK